MRKEIKIFCIKIIDIEALSVLYTLGRTVAFSMFGELIGYMMWVFFMIFFFDIFPICRE
jgi:hypothetical protein